MATMLGVLDVSRRMSGLKPACWNFWDSITSWIFRYVSFLKQGPFGPFYIDFTGPGQMPVCAGTAERLASKLPFQYQKLLVQCGLGDIELFGCSGDVVFLGYL